LEISPKEGECLTGFDRIYIGAAIESSDLPKIKNLLSPGGVLVGPVDDEMVKMVRIGPREQQDDDCSDTIVSDDSSSNSITSTEDLEFTTQIISSVRFAPLINSLRSPPSFQPKCGVHFQIIYTLIHFNDPFGHCYYVRVLNMSNQNQDQGNE
jgi:hypothetical protein